MKDHSGSDASVLITTANISYEDIHYAQNMGIFIIDRKRLRSILKKVRRISDFLEREKD
jgi:hypothetical protein